MLYRATIRISPRCRGEPIQKAMFKPPRNSFLKREAEVCSYFHFKAMQTLLLLLTPLLTESISTKLPREIPQSSVSHLMPTGEGKELPTQTASQLLQASPSPQSLKITAHSRCDAWASRFLHRHSGAVSWNFKGNPTDNSFGYC